MEWLDQVFKANNGEDISSIVMLLWSLWKSMNELVWNQRGMGVDEIVESA